MSYSLDAVMIFDDEADVVLHRWEPSGRVSKLRLTVPTKSLRGPAKFAGELLQRAGVTLKIVPSPRWAAVLDHALARGRKILASCHAGEGS